MVFYVCLGNNFLGKDPPAPAAVITLLIIMGQWAYTKFVKRIYNNKEVCAQSGPD
jgi:hypothetical protein